MLVIGLMFICSIQRKENFPTSLCEDRFLKLFQYDLVIFAYLPDLVQEICKNRTSCKVLRHFLYFKNARIPGFEATIFIDHRSEISKIIIIVGSYEELCSL